MRERGALWPAALPSGGPARGEIHLWFVDLAQPPVDDALGIRLLSEAERVRAERFRMRSLRRRYVVGRASLRTLLGLASGCSPDEVQIVQREDGKPHLASGGDLHFNVAHSDDLLLMAISMAGEVGVDIERLRPLPELAGLARRVLTATERLTLQAAPAGERVRIFLRAWARKEAVLKSTGHGLRIATSAIEVTLDDPLKAAWKFVGDGEPPSLAPECLRGLLPVATSEAALACTSTARIRCQSWAKQSPV